MDVLPSAEVMLHQLGVLAGSPPEDICPLLRQLALVLGDYDRLGELPPWEVLGVGCAAEAAIRRALDRRT